MVTAIAEYIRSSSVLHYECTGNAGNLELGAEWEPVAGHSRPLPGIKARSGNAVAL